MLTVIAIVLGLLVTLVRAKITRRELSTNNLQGGWLVFGMVIIQTFVLRGGFFGKYFSDQIMAWSLVGTMGILLIFTLINLKMPGFWALTLGLIANLLVITLNGGWMPISPETLSKLVTLRYGEKWVIGSRVEQTKDRIMAWSDTKLPWLSDCLTYPAWWPWKTAFSVGDVIIALGIFLVILSFSNAPKTPAGQPPFIGMSADETDEVNEKKINE